MIRRLFQVLKWVVPLAAAFFVGRIIFLQWQKVRDFQWQFDPGFLALSFLATSSWFFIRAFVWGTILGHFGRPIPYRECVRIFTVSELSRYVPGTVWQYLSRVYLAGRWGVPPAATVTSALMDLLLVALAAVPLALWRMSEVFPVLGSARGTLLIVFPLGALALLQPPVLNAVARRLLPWIRMQYTPITLRFAALCGLWACYLLLWAVFGAGFVLFARSLTPVDSSLGAEMAGQYAASWLVGLLSAVVAPGGIGVREGMLGLLLSRSLPQGTAFLVAALSRLWLIALELFWAAMAQAFLRVDRPDT